MRIYDIDSGVKITDFENFMSIYTDKDGNYRYNLNETLYLDIDKESLGIYETKSDMQWSLISYELYETIGLAWLLMKVNGVKPKDTFKTIPASTKIYYPSKDQVSEILEYIAIEDKT